MTDVRPELILLLAVATGVLAVTRVVRLIVDDTYPPMLRLRESYVSHVPERWHELIECPWCTAPYVAAPAVAWFATLVAWPDWTANVWIWWVVNAWAAVSWLAAFLNVRDLPPDQRE